MLFVLLIVLWYQDGTFFASSNAYTTQKQCEHMRASAMTGIQEGAIDGVAALEADCIAASNPDTAQHP